MSLNCFSASTAVEEWRPIGGFPAYEVSSFGRVRRAVDGATGPKAGFILKARLIRRYPGVNIRTNGKNRSYFISRLVTIAFHGPPPSSRHQAAHNDGDPLNNHASNLRWATPAENEADKILHGTTCFGERNHSAKLTNKQVQEILRLHAAGHLHIEIAARFGVSRSTVSRVGSGAMWKHVVSLEPAP